MAGSINKVILIGNMCADPEIKRTQDGRPIANLRIATSESWRDKNTGERKERTEFHRVICFKEGLCKVIEQWVKKGSKVYIEGALQTRKWTNQEGKDQYSTEVVLQGFNGSLTMLDSRNEASQGQFERDQEEWRKNGSPSSNQYEDQSTGNRSFQGETYDESKHRDFHGAGDIDDPIPFSFEWRA